MDYIRSSETLAITYETIRCHNPDQETAWLKNRFQLVRFQVLTAAIMHMTAFLDTAPCSLVDLAVEK
jgi:hypothetical protein